MVRSVVGIKWVPNTQAVRFDPKTGTLIREGVPSIINPPDLSAIELALRLKERYGGEVIAITMAPPSATKGLEHVLGMGIDRAILISDRAFAGADTLATSYVLAEAIKKIVKEIGKVDLVLFGQETIDSSTAHIPAQTASWLGWPYIYYIRDLKIDNHKAIVERVLEDRTEKYELELPSVISVLMESLEARDIRLIHKLRAKMKEPILVWSNKEMGLNPKCIGLRGSPTTVSKITWTPEVPRKKVIYKPKDPDDAVRWLISMLLKDEKTSKIIQTILKR